MAFRLAEAYVELSSRGFTGVSRAIAGVTSSFRGLGHVMTGVRNMIPGVGTALAALGVGAGVVGLLKLAADAEQTAVSFEVMLGSAARAQKMIGDLRSFAERTPFGFTGLSEAVRTMISFGVEAEDVMADLDRLSNVAAGNEQKLSSLALVFGQVRAAGKLTGGDLLQLVNAGFNPLESIAKRTGETMAEVKSRMSDGAVTFDEVRQAFIDATAAGGRFYQMNERQSRTLGGLWSTLKDNVLVALRTIGEALVDTFDIKGLLANAIEATKSFAASLKQIAEVVAPAVKQALATVGDFAERMWGRIADGKTGGEMLRSVVARMTSSLLQFLENLSNVFETMETRLDLIFAKMRANAFVLDHPHFFGKMRAEGRENEGREFLRKQFGIDVLEDRLKRLGAERAAAAERAAQRRQAIEQAIANGPQAPKFDFKAFALEQFDAGKKLAQGYLEGLRRDGAKQFMDLGKRFGESLGVRSLGDLKLLPEMLRDRIGLRNTAMMGMVASLMAGGPLGQLSSLAVGALGTFGQSFARPKPQEQEQQSRMAFIALTERAKQIQLESQRRPEIRLLESLLEQARRGVDIDEEQLWELRQQARAAVAG